VDAYKGSFIGDTLLAELNKRVEEIKAKYPEPPKRPERSKHKGKRRR
jgi:nucleolar protein 56